MEGTLEVAVVRYADYRRAAEKALIAYRRRHFAGRSALFEAGPRGERLFRSQAAHLNFFDPALYHVLTRRPRAFRRLGNPQVLAISVFGTLARREGLGLLAGVRCDDGEPVVATMAEAEALSWEPQRAVDLTGGQGVVDLWFETAHSALAVQGRLLERGLGPLAGVVEALAAGEGPRLVLLVYDGRNPAFAPGRRADDEFRALGKGLPAGMALRRTTWQRIAAAMAREDWYSDLLAWLAAKYGIY